MALNPVNFIKETLKKISKRPAFTNTRDKRLIGITLFASVFALIGFYQLFISNAASPYGEILRSADELVVRYDLPMIHPLTEDDFNQGMPPAMLLYGNGLMLCLDHANAHANAQASPLMSLKQRQLTEAEVKNYFAKVRSLGFDSLLTRTVPTDTTDAPVGATESLSLITSVGERKATLLSNEKSDVFNSITSYVNDECKKAKDDFSPDEIVLESIKLPDPADAQTETIPDLQFPIAERDTEKKSTVVAGEDAKRIKEKLGKGNKLYKSTDGKKIRLRALPKIPEYRVSELILNGESGVDKVSAATFRKVRFLYVVASDEATPANAASQISDLAASLPVYYNTQLGKTFTSDGATVVRGSKTAAQYKTCPTASTCTTADNAAYASYFNLVSEFKLSGYSTIVMYSWSTERCIGLGGPAYGTGLDNVNIGDYGLGAWSARMCTWNGVKELLGAHEGGHSFGLSHTTDQTIMSGTYTIPNGYVWPINSNQINLLNSASPWFNGPTAQIPVPVASGTTFVSVSPSRLLDTRPGNSTIDGQMAGIGPRPGGSVTEVQIAGRGGIPSDALAAALNVISLNQTGEGFVSVYPCGIPVPGTTNINFSAKSVASNMVITKLGTGGKICLYSNVTSDLVVDVNGAFPVASSASFTNINPARMLETRPGYYTVDGQYNSIGRFAPGSITQLQIAGRAGVPADVSAVSLNLIGISAQSDGYLVVYPCDSGVPNTSTLAYRAGKVVANATIAKVVNGKVCIYSSAAVDAVVDLNGAFKNITSFKSVKPARLLETRIGNYTVDGQYNGIGARSGGSTTEIQVVGRAGIPADAVAAVINVTAVNTGGAGFMTVYPCGTAIPTASNVNFDSAGSIVANSVISQLGGGKICIYSLVNSDIVVDINGVFTASDTNQTAATVAVPVTSVNPPPILTCPAGYSGSYPNCVAPVCPVGYSGTYPNCVQTSCPSGYTGTYPNCSVPTSTKCSGTTLYTGAGYTGTTQSVLAGSFDHPLRIGNDSISSVRVPTGCEVVLHMHLGYTGATQVLRYSWPGSTSDPWNDISTSVTVREKTEINSTTPISCSTNGVTVYKDSNFAGTAQSLSSGKHDYNKLNLGPGDNSISSVRVKPGCKAILYQNSDFTGATKVLIGDWNSVYADEPWNNITSGIIIKNFATGLAESTQLVKNGNFNEGMKDWATSNPTGGLLGYSIKTDGGQTGLNYFEGISSPSYGGTLYQTVPITAVPGTSYQLSGYVKSPSCTPFYGHLTLWSLWASVTNSYTSFTADCSWRLFTTTYTVTNANDKELRIQIPFNSPNLKLNVDNIKLSKMKYTENL